MIEKSRGFWIQSVTHINIGVSKMISTWLRNLGVVALLAGLSAPAVFAGELKTALADAAQKAAALDTAIDEFSDYSVQYAVDASNKTGIAVEAGNFTYEYIQLRLKKDGKKLEDVKDDPIESIADSNLKAQITSLNEYVPTGIEASTEWYSRYNPLVAGHADLKKDLAALTKAINKRKAKWLKSDKYKKKIEDQEKSLQNLKSELDVAEEKILDLKKMLPLPKELEKIKIELSDPIGKVEGMVTKIFSGLFKSYLKELEQGKQVSTTLRKTDFLAEIKMIKEMIDDADELEKIAN
jgi:hypothetical protein